MSNAFLFITLLLFCSVSYSSPISETLVPEYAELREHVRNTPHGLDKDFAPLVEYLVKPATNDIEKTYAIYYWVTNNIKYDVKGFLSGDLGDLSPFGVLRSKVAVCSGYSRLFNELARLANLEVKEIVGIAKGATYANSANFGSHSWNAVKLNGDWKLLDTTWAAGHVDDKFNRKQNDFFFLTNPSEFIYSHYPDDPEWQLLSDVINKKTFANYADLKSSFFKYKLKLTSHKESVISTDKSLKIIIESPENVIFSSELINTSSSEEHKNYTFIQKVGVNNHFDVSFPNNGYYNFNIYSKLSSDLESSYTNVVKYAIDVKNLQVKGSTLPKLFTAYARSNGILYGPKVQTLKSKKEYLFEIYIPNIPEVVVIEHFDSAKPVFHKLSKLGENYLGKIKVSGDRISISAKLNPKEKHYSSLVEYEVK